MVLSKLASTERLFTLPLLCVLALVFPHVRSSHQRCSVKKDVLRNFGKFTGKHLCQSLFFNKVAGAACNLIKKETLAQVFSCEFCGISKNTILAEHVWATASVKCQVTKQYHKYSEGYQKAQKYQVLRLVYHKDQFYTLCYAIMR